MRTLKPISTITLASIMALSFSGCADMTRAQKGALMGALGAATVGGLIGSKSGDAGKGALIGGAVGAIGGAVIGNYMDKQAKELERVAETRRVDDGVVVTMKDKILFDIGQATLKPESRASLQKIGGVLAKYEKTDITIAGHTDSTGSLSTNQTLSERRAQAVRDYLNTQNVDTSRLKITGFGPGAPIASNDTAEGRSQNRRVEIHIAPSDVLVQEAKAKEQAPGS